jgi:hypothetical protein
VQLRETNSSVSVDHPDEQSEKSSLRGSPEGFGFSVPPQPEQAATRTRPMSRRSGERVHMSRSTIRPSRGNGEPPAYVVIKPPPSFFDGEVTPRSFANAVRHFDGLNEPKPKLATSGQSGTLVRGGFLSLGFGSATLGDGT